MDDAAFLRSLEDGLQPMVRAMGGELQVASDPEHVFMILQAASPAKFLVILNFGGDESVEPDTAPGVVYWTLAATIMGAKGLTIGQVDTHRATSGRNPLLHLASLLGRWIRGFSGNHPDLHEYGFRYTGKNWLEVEGLPTRQLTLTHRCILTLDDPIDVPCQFEKPTNL